MSMKIRSFRFATPLISAGFATALLSGCAAANTAEPASTGQDAATQASSVQISEAWIKAAHDGMTGGFAILENTSDKDIDLVKVDTGLARSVELHEMAGSGTAMSMKELDGPLNIPAHATVELAPGGNHVMLMGLKQELKVGESPKLVLTFGDESTSQVPFEIKSYTGAKESYDPGVGDPEEMGHSERSDD
ncbi:copper chaperone PCu(A)C [Paeniglutamicibacter antarcticus]|uniref:Copper chaperone PCu(A)C n=1 Tax=Paeniglutamicibacter antarcticus TaxID=494023 RepID=A0ABP9TNV3_9MICC